ncbi:hypothetical protein N9007_01705 [bacterium]|nr:hypothetical protein [Mariniblastus sp.]MDB4399796.1 hypothetical protein [bacterium]
MQMAGGHSGDNLGEQGGPGGRQSFRELIQLPRWVVYAQALLLVVTAGIFFMVGLLVGELASPSSADFNRTLDCRVYGSIAYREDGNLKADRGAVVLILPANRKPTGRSQGELVHPDSFQALDNEAIDRIHRLGGAVVRADENGQFEVTIDSNAVVGVPYQVLIVSKNGIQREGNNLTKDQFASLAEFFSPVEDLIEKKPFFWMAFNADGERVDMPEVEF